MSSVYKAGSCPGFVVCSGGFQPPLQMRKAIFLGHNQKAKMERVDKVLYHLNIGYNIPGSGSSGYGIDNAIRNRMVLLKKNGIHSKVVTVRFSTHRYAERLHGIDSCEIENMYDFFQEAGSAKQRKSKSITVHDLFPSNVYSVVYDQKYSNYRIYIGEAFIAYVICYENDDILRKGNFFKNNVYFVSYMDKSRRMIKRCYYDYRGYLSLEVFFGDN